MHTSTHLPVIITGKLVIKTIHGRNGDFNVGLLETTIGSFSVKNQELEQYGPGRYEGQFVLSKIYPRAWSYGTQSGIEICVRLDEMNIVASDALTDSDEQKLLPQVNDPLDEESRETPPVTTAAPAKERSDTKPAQFVVPTREEREVNDQQLFGSLWPFSDSVELDKTVSRHILRQQTARLNALGYTFDAKTQRFTKATEPSQSPIIH